MGRSRRIGTRRPRHEVGNRRICRSHSVVLRNRIQILHRERFARHDHRQKPGVQFIAQSGVDECLPAKCMTPPYEESFYINYLLSVPNDEKTVVTKDKTMLNSIAHQKLATLNPGTM